MKRIYFVEFADRSITDPLSVADARQMVRDNPGARLITETDDSDNRLQDLSSAHLNDVRFG